MQYGGRTRPVLRQSRAQTDKASLIRSGEWGTRQLRVYDETGRAASVMRSSRVGGGALACPTFRLPPRWSPMMRPWALLLGPYAASPATLAAAMGIVDRGGGHPAMLFNGPFAGFPRSGRCAAPSRRSRLALRLVSVRQVSAQEAGRNRETGRETAVPPRQLGGVADGKTELAFFIPPCRAFICFIISQNSKRLASTFTSLEPPHPFQNTMTASFPLSPSFSKSVFLLLVRVSHHFLAGRSPLVSARFSFCPRGTCLGPPPRGAFLGLASGRTCASCG